MSDRIDAVGLAWFRQEDYAALRQIFTDGDKMPDTWEEWLKKAEKMEDQMRSRFDVVERVYIDPATFPAWCAAHGASVDRQGRHAFVAATVAEKY